MCDADLMQSGRENVSWYFTRWRVKALGKIIYPWFNQSHVIGLIFLSYLCELCVKLTMFASPSQNLNRKRRVTSDRAMWSGAQNSTSACPLAIWFWLHCNMSLDRLKRRYECNVPATRVFNVVARNPWSSEGQKRKIRNYDARSRSVVSTRPRKSILNRVKLTTCPGSCHIYFSWNCEHA